MPDIALSEVTIRTLLTDFHNNQQICGFEAFVVMKTEPRLKAISLSDKKNSLGKDFRTVLKEMVFSVIGDNYLATEAEYAAGTQLADNQHKLLILKQEGSFSPFSFLDTNAATPVFSSEDLSDSIGLIFKIRKGNDAIWCYQHLWSIMVPNKKKTGFMARINKFENETMFEEQTDPLLTIAKKIDILIINGHLVTGNVSLLQRNFGFQDYIYQAATRAISNITSKDLVANADKLTDYIGRGKPKYAKKMMRIGPSKVLALSTEELLNRIRTVERWKDKFHIDETKNQIVLETYSEVENLIDLFDERFTRSEITNTEYDTDVKTVAQPI